MSAPSTKHPDESTYLQEQAEDAKAAIRQIGRDLKSSVAQAADPRKLTASHPFLAVGGAALAGFAAAWFATPNEEERTARRFARLERERHKPEPAPASNGHERKSPGTSLWMQLVRLAAPALTTAVSSMLNSAMASRTAAEQAAGHFKRSTDASDAGDTFRDI